jgi:hypothetical protein
VCGLLFGVVVGFAALLADAPLAIVVITPLATGTAAMIFGDQFWYWVLKLSWVWW